VLLPLSENREGMNWWLPQMYIETEKEQMDTSCWKRQTAKPDRTARETNNMLFFH
jgi:hypothetical protein